MKHQASFAWIRGLVSYLPEIWFTILLAVCILGSARYLILMEWQTVTACSLLVMLVLACLLLRQIVSEKRKLGIALGVFFSLASFYMILALLSECKEFPRGDPRVTTMLLTGGLLFGGSLVMSVWMWVRSVASSSTRT